MTRVLLLTGARSLATRPGAEAWARAKIAEALVGVDLGIIGDARDGVDPWAWDEAASQCPKCGAPVLTSGHDETCPRNRRKRAERGSRG